jgi:hypothetical protein
MIFSIQHYIEDYFQRRNLSDIDQYAVRVANTFVDHLDEPNNKRLLKSLRRIRTVFYQNNEQLDRTEFELILAGQLRARYKKKTKSMTFPVA